MNRMERYEDARAQYRAAGADTELAMEKLRHVPISLHCWQGDDAISVALKQVNEAPQAPTLLNPSVARIFFHTL